MTPGEVLSAAADEIEADPTRSVGAAVIGITWRAWPDPDPEDVAILQTEVHDLFAEFLGAESWEYPYALDHWSMVPGRTQAEVVAAMRQAAKG